MYNILYINIIYNNYIYICIYIYIYIYISKLPAAASRSRPGGKGMHAGKISFDGGANGDLQVKCELGYLKDTKFNKKLSWTDPTWSPELPNLLQKVVKWNRNCVKNNVSGAKGCEKRAKGSQSEPTGDQNAYTNLPSDNVTKK